MLWIKTYTDSPMRVRAGVARSIRPVVRRGSELTVARPDPAGAWMIWECWERWERRRSATLRGGGPQFHRRE